ncbi:probable endochitinase [Maniola hyperantus]|uniref:probable endochitinase n=1 Tax=Aphantopus hyperantus TaxID=2795564 RepID=UPI00156A598C|nr:probable endochitinase [Maniola hyperantus]
MGYFGNICALCVLVFALGSINFIEARSTNDALMRHEAKRDIPERCTTNSVTPVTCERANITDNLLPHPDDCQLFYYCLAATLPPICRQCPARLHFNPQKHVCDQPEQAGCHASNSSSSTPVSTTGEPDSTTPTRVSTTRAPVSTTRRTTTTARASTTCRSWSGMQWCSV